MFHHKHPYEPFIPSGTQTLIVGTLPPPRFSGGVLKDRDVDFCYGSQDGLLWPVLDQIFNLKLDYEPSQKAIIQRQEFLKSRHIGICDIVESCNRIKIDASDLGMQNIVLRNLLGYLKVYSQIKSIVFTGGNSKNGPEYLFRRHLKIRDIKLDLVSNKIPREHKFVHPDTLKSIHTVSLMAPSGSANRAIGALEVYKTKKQENPQYNTMDYRVEQYRKFF